MKRPNKFTNPWTQEHIQFLKDNYNKMSIEEMEIAINHPKRSIYAMASRYQLTVNKWNDELDKFIQDNYQKMTYSKIAKILGKTQPAVVNRAKVLGIRKENIGRWTEFEIQFLKENFFKLPYDEIKKTLNRTTKQIHQKAYELKLTSSNSRYKKLKQEQRLFIINNFDKYSDFDLSIMFSVSESAIADLRKKHGLYKTSKRVSNMSKPEKIINSFLKDLKIEFSYDFLVGTGYYADFVFKSNKIIEIQGDYYHCNPKLYPDGPRPEQIEYIIQDYFKKCFYLGNGYEVLYIWEHDIINNIKNVYQEIIQFLLPSSLEIN